MPKKKLPDANTFSFELARNADKVVTDTTVEQPMAAGLKGRVNEVMGVVKDMNSRINGFQDQLDSLESKLDTLLKHNGL